MNQYERFHNRLLELLQGKKYIREFNLQALNPGGK
jgi:hypothetical protein